MLSLSNLSGAVLVWCHCLSVFLSVILCVYVFFGLNMERNSRGHLSSGQNCVLSRLCYSRDMERVSKIVNPRFLNGHQGCFFSLENFWTLRSFQNCATFLAEKKKKKKEKVLFWLSSLERLGLIWRKIRPALRARAIVWSQVHLAGRQEKKMCAFKFLTWKFLKMNNWVKKMLQIIVVVFF